METRSLLVGLFMCFTLLDSHVSSLVLKNTQPHAKVKMQFGAEHSPAPCGTCAQEAAKIDGETQLGIEVPRGAGQRNVLLQKIGTYLAVVMKALAETVESPQASDGSSTHLDFHVDAEFKDPEAHMTITEKHPSELVLHTSWTGEPDINGDPGKHILDPKAKVPLGINPSKVLNAATIEALKKALSSSLQRHDSTLATDPSDRARISSLLGHLHAAPSPGIGAPIPIMPNIIGAGASAGFDPSWGGGAPGFDPSWGGGAPGFDPMFSILGAGFGSPVPGGGNVLLLNLSLPLSKLPPEVKDKLLSSPHVSPGGHFVVPLSSLDPGSDPLSQVMQYLAGPVLSDVSGEIVNPPVVETSIADKIFIDPILPFEPVKEVETIKEIIDPVKVIESVKYIDPIKHVEPVKLIEPIKYIDPIKHIETIKFIDPIEEINYIKPIDPIPPIGVPVMESLRASASTSADGNKLAVAETIKAYHPMVVDDPIERVNIIKPGDPFHHHQLPKFSAYKGEFPRKFGTLDKSSFHERRFENAFLRNDNDLLSQNHIVVYERARNLPIEDLDFKENKSFTSQTDNKEEQLLEIENNNSLKNNIHNNQETTDEPNMFKDHSIVAIIDLPDNKTVTAGSGKDPETQVTQLGNFGNRKQTNLMISKILASIGMKPQYDLRESSSVLDESNKEVANVVKESVPLNPQQELRPNSVISPYIKSIMHSTETNTQSLIEHEPILDELSQGKGQSGHSTPQSNVPVMEHARSLSEDDLNNEHLAGSFSAMPVDILTSPPTYAQKLNKQSTSPPFVILDNVYPAVESPPSYIVELLDNNAPNDFFPLNENIISGPNQIPYNFILEKTDMHPNYDLTTHSPKDMYPSESITHNQNENLGSMLASSMPSSSSLMRTEMGPQLPLMNKELAKELVAFSQPLHQIPSNVNNAEAMNLQRNDESSQHNVHSNTDHNSYVDKHSVQSSQGNVNRNVIHVVLPSNPKLQPQPDSYISPVLTTTPNPEITDLDSVQRTTVPPVLFTSEPTIQQIKPVIQTNSPQKHSSSGNLASGQNLANTPSHLSIGQDTQKEEKLQRALEIDNLETTSHNGPEYGTYVDVKKLIPLNQQLAAISQQILNDKPNIENKIIIISDKNDIPLLKWQKDEFTIPGKFDSKMILPLEGISDPQLRAKIEQAFASASNKPLYDIQVQSLPRQSLDSNTKSVISTPRTVESVEKSSTLPPFQADKQPAPHFESKGQEHTMLDISDASKHLKTGIKNPKSFQDVSVNPVSERDGLDSIKDSIFLSKLKSAINSEKYISPQKLDGFYDPKLTNTLNDAKLLSHLNNELLKLPLYSEDYITSIPSYYDVKSLNPSYNLDDNSAPLNNEIITMISDDRHKFSFDEPHLNSNGNSVYHYFDTKPSNKAGDREDDIISVIQFPDEKSLSKLYGNKIPSLLESGYEINVPEKISFSDVPISQFYDIKTHTEPYSTEKQNLKVYEIEISAKPSPSPFYDGPIFPNKYNADDMYDMKSQNSPLNDNIMSHAYENKGPEKMYYKEEYISPSVHEKNSVTKYHTDQYSISPQSEMEISSQMDTELKRYGEPNKKIKLGDIENLSQKANPQNSLYSYYVVEALNAPYGTDTLPDDSQGKFYILEPVSASKNEGIMQNKIETRISSLNSKISPMILPEKDDLSNGKLRALDYPITRIQEGQMSKDIPTPPPVVFSEKRVFQDSDINTGVVYPYYTGDEPVKPRIICLTEEGNNIDILRSLKDDITKLKQKLNCE